VLSPKFTIFAVFDVSLVITPLTGVINYVFCIWGLAYYSITTNTNIKIIKNSGTVGAPLPVGPPVTRRSSHPIVKPLRVRLVVGTVEKNLRFQT